MHYEIATNVWVSVLVGLVAVVAAVQQYFKFRKQFAEIRIQEAQALRALDAIRSSEEESLSSTSSENASPDELRFERLWAMNQGRINNYHKIAIGQARTSFLSSQVVTALGFILILVVGIVAARATSIAGAVAAGAVGTIGGGLSAYISSTFMKSQTEASAQLQQFFLQPVEFARILAAERLLEGMTDEDKSRTRSAMIAAMLNAPASEKNS